ncbi:hypothetical protein [Thiohalophilus thiocyanatoxydans]|uniref:Uncharacterized protein n=1 Tax=Thiohalophilus thiocyanatoxydans TaxID=381308 RepID=A0A4R8IWJ4_9GAMM|nr:hypothetical protein [Thiohalophilus thiocyanatoxydans]TDY01753.1 hypothetical protein EDC23_1644 [Thiohalophilus thiocyanatoxydans]
MRDRIDHRVCLVHQRTDSLVHQVRALARSPAALPVAFVFGILAERLDVSDIKGACGFLTGQANAMQIISSFIGSPAR